MKTRFDRWIDLGFSLIPLANNDCKPQKKWKEEMEQTPDKEKTRTKLKMNKNAAVACGKVSGNLVILDCDDPRLAEKIEIDTLTTKTPSGGMHIYVRSQKVPKKCRTTYEKQQQESYSDDKDDIIPTLVEDGGCTATNVKTSQSEVIQTLNSSYQDFQKQSEESEPELYLYDQLVVKYPKLSEDQMYSYIDHYMEDLVQGG